MHALTRTMRLSFCLIVTNFVGKFKMNFVCFTSESLTTTVSLKPKHVVFLQFHSTSVVKPVLD